MGTFLSHVNISVFCGYRMMYVYVQVQEDWKDGSQNALMDAYNIWEKLKQVEANPKLYSLFSFIMRVLYNMNTLDSQTINQHFSLQLLACVIDADAKVGFQQMEN
jgi:hypothetical protein